MRKTLTWWYVFPVFLWSWRALLQASQISPDALTPKQTSNSSFFSTCLKGLPCDFLPHTTQPFFDLSLLSLSFKIQNKTHAKKTTNRPAYTAILHLIFFVLVLLKKSGKRTRARHVRARFSGYFIKASLYCTCADRMTLCCQGHYILETFLTFSFWNNCEMVRIGHWGY